MLNYPVQLESVSDVRFTGNRSRMLVRYTDWRMACDSASCDSQKQEKEEERFLVTIRFLCNGALPLASVRSLFRPGN